MRHAKTTPHRCPVCDGRGQVPFAFYTSKGATTRNDPRMEPCRACDNGVVWSMEIVTDVIEIRREGGGDDVTGPTSWRN